MAVTQPTLLLLGALLAFPTAEADFSESPAAVDGATTINVDEAWNLFRHGAVFVDVRMAKAFDSGRIPGAVNLALKHQFTQPNLSLHARPEQPVVVYCGGPHCPLSAKATGKAVSWGYQHLFYFREGLPGWKKAGYPVE